MRFIHIADIHLDAPFVSLANKKNLSEQRRIEQRNAIKEIVEYIKKNDIPYFFIAGDLYEQEYIKKSTIDYINSLFQTILTTKIFITPGNHDPYIKNSFYKCYKWSENVHIFTDKLEIIETKDADIYGYGFNDFYMDNPYKNITIKNKNKINILITHGSLDASENIPNAYNSIKTKDIESSGFDYVALGHIHKKSFQDYKNQKIVYPGSMVSLGFDELGERGAIEGNITKNELNLDFLKINTKSFTEKEIDISNVNSKEDLIQRLNEDKYDRNAFYKIILIGKKNFEINVSEMLEIIGRENIIKITDNTKEKYDIQEIAKQSNLAGIYAKNILNKMSNSEIKEKEKLLKAFEIGIEVLNK